MSTAYNPPKTRRLADLLGVGVFVLFLVTLFLLPTPGEQTAATAAVADSSDREFAIVGARVFDGEKTWPRADVWIANGEIKAIDEALDLPQDVERIDGAGHTLMPGLIDAHVHAWNAARVDAARLGVTTLLDQFTGPSEVQTARKDREAGGATDRADLFSAGILATAEGGHGTQFGLAVQTLEKPEQAADWVAARKKEGSDWIKIVVEPGWRSGINTLDHETAGAVIKAAHDHGLKAVVHVSRLDDALAMARLGADGLVHVWRDRIPTPEEVEVFRQTGIFVIPTLVVMAGMVDTTAVEALAETFDDRLSSVQKNGLSQRFPPEVALDWAIPIESVRRLANAGVPILAGSDAPNPTTAMGLSMHLEVQFLIEAGLSTEAALRAATSVPAEHFGVPRRGSITPGHLADLLLVKGDPTKNIEDSQHLVTVWKRGHEIDPIAPDEDGETIGEVAKAPEETLLADFENGLESRFGHGWVETTDQRLGGQSVVDLSVEDGALAITGEIKGGAMFPWAGALVFPGDGPMSPIDLSGRKTLSFRTRGDGRRYSVMLFSGTMQGIPPSQFFNAGEEWTDVTLSLDSFAGADLSTLRGISFNANQPTGAFRLEIDDVEIR